MVTAPQGWVPAPTEETALGPPRSPFFRPRVPDTPTDGRIASGDIGRWSWKIDVPSDASVSAPYYLEQPRTSDLYTWPDEQQRWAHPFDAAPIHATIELGVARPDGGAKADLR